MSYSSLDALERAFFDIHREGHSLDTGAIRYAIFHTLCITRDTPIGIAIERIESAHVDFVKTAERSLAAFRKLCNTFAGIDYARPAKGVTAARHESALLRALRDELTLQELFSIASELRVAVDGI